MRAGKSLTGHSPVVLSGNWQFPGPNPYDDWRDFLEAAPATNRLERERESGGFGVARGFLVLEQFAVFAAGVGSGEDAAQLSMPGH